MPHLKQVPPVRTWRYMGFLVGATLVLVVWLFFLRKPSSPSIIVVHESGRPGLIELSQFKSVIDEPLTGYIAWWEPHEQDPARHALRHALQAAGSDHWSWPSASGALKWIKQDFGYEPERPEPYFKICLTPQKAREFSIWRNMARSELSPPIPLITDLSDQVLHIARIPPREPASENTGHVKPSSRREAVWLKPISLKSNNEEDAKAEVQKEDAKAEMKTANSSRSRKLSSGDYLVGWVFVLTTCHPKKCGLFGRDGNDCLSPQTLTAHVLGVTHLAIPRHHLYGSNGRDASRSTSALVNDIRRGGGLTLLTGANYDYISLRVSHFKAGEPQPSDIAGSSSANWPRPSHTRECSIARLSEQLYEILASINHERSNDSMRAGVSDANAAEAGGDTELVFVAPTALDLKLNEGEYVIVGLDGVPAPLRSHYQSPAVSTPVDRVDLVDLEDLDPRPKRPERPVVQARNPAARISAAVEE